MIFKAFSIAPVEPLPVGKATKLSLSAPKDFIRLFWA